MERGCFGNIQAGGMKDRIRRNQGLGVLPQKMEQIFVVGRGELLEADEIAVSVEIEIKDCNSQGQGHCDGDQEQGMSSQALHAETPMTVRQMRS
jgi:hypothetical protein